MLILLISFIGSFAQTDIEKGLSAITVPAVKGQLEFLASDWMEGRACGTKGEYLAADYIASMFKLYGIEPLGDETMIMPSRGEMWRNFNPEKTTSYFQNFGLISYASSEDQQFSIITGKAGSQSAVDFGYKTDFSVMAGTTGQSATAPLVFIGYGISDPEKGYDELNKIDLEGKIAVILNGFPGHKDTTSAAYEKFHTEGRFAQYRYEWDKIEKIKKKGAIGIIRINPGKDILGAWAKNQIYPVHGRYYEADTRLNSYYDTSMELPGDTLDKNIPVFTVTNRVASQIAEGTGLNIANFEEQAKSSLKPASKLLPGKTLFFKTNVTSEVVNVRNVLGYIEGENKNECIVIGAHYDHVGKYNGWTWNGADDNASGTVGMMTLAKAFKASGKKPEKSIIFAAWTAEEKGLFGSEYFVKHLPEGKKVVLNLNYDMIGRDEETDTLKNKAEMTYTEAYGGIKTLTEKNITDYKLNLDLSYSPEKQPGGGSDHAPFAEAGIPVFYFMAAMHPDYHQPSDEVDKINWEKLADIIRIGFLNTWEFANSNEYLKPVEEQNSEQK